VKVLGTNEEMNMSLEKAGRMADFLELAVLLVDDAQNRKESCGGHFREESQTEEGEAKRIDNAYSYVAFNALKDNKCMVMPDTLYREPIECKCEDEILANLLIDKTEKSPIFVIMPFYEWYSIYHYRGNRMTTLVLLVTFQ